MRRIILWHIHRLLSSEEINGRSKGFLRVRAFEVVLWSGWNIVVSIPRCFSCLEGMWTRLMALSAGVFLFLRGVGLRCFHLKMNTTENISTARHLNNKGSQRPLKIHIEQLCRFIKIQSYHGVTFDRRLIYKNNWGHSKKDWQAKLYTKKTGGNNMGSILDFNEGIDLYSMLQCGKILCNCMDEKCSHQVCRY